MTKQYEFITTYARAGHTVLAYDRRVPKTKVRHITAHNVASRVAMVGGIVHVDGVSAEGWTFCLKP